MLLSSTLYLDGSKPFTASVASTMTTVSNDDTTMDTTPYTTSDTYPEWDHTMTNSYQFRQTVQPGVYNRWFSEPLHSINSQYDPFNHRQKRNTDIESKSIVRQDPSAILIFLIFLWNAF